MVSAEQGGVSFIGAELQSSRVEQQIAYKSKMAESSKAAAQQCSSRVSEQQSRAAAEQRVRIYWEQ